MASQPIRKYGLTSAGVVGWVAVGDALSTFVWGLCTQVHLMVV